MSRAMEAGVIDAAGAIRNVPGGYMDRSSRPLAGLLLLLPLIVVYEVGTRYFTTAALHGGEQQVIAFSKMQQFFRFFGANGRHLPALAVVASLLCWHIFRHDAWRVELTTLFGMAMESIILSLPLFLMGVLLARYYPLAGIPSGHASQPVTAHSMRDMLIMSMGAGVYEEFVFRLAAFSLLSTVFRDMMKMHAALGYPLMVLISGALFAAYHYWGTSEPFVGRIFAFRTIAGIYFGFIFLLRGFGITAASHSIYDLIFTATLLA